MNYLKAFCIVMTIFALGVIVYGSIYFLIVTWPYATVFTLFAVLVGCLTKGVGDAL